MRQPPRSRRPVGLGSCLALCLALGAAAAPGAETLNTPWTRSAVSADEGCSWQGLGDRQGPRRNAHYIAAPAPDQPWETWLAGMRAYRDGILSHPDSARDQAIRLSFDGVRAWVRLGRPWAWTADLQPGETLDIVGRARWVSGNRRLCLAFDWCARADRAEGRWQAWSTVVASTAIPTDGQWHDLRLSAPVPPFDAARSWCRPILGMDGTFDATRGEVLLADLACQVPLLPARLDRWQGLAATADQPLDLSLYRRPDLAWVTRNFVCGFVMTNDRSFLDPAAAVYRVDDVCAEAEREFGGFDSVVLWQAYPRIGTDPRNQFDFWRDLPGGLAGVREAVDAFHRHGVRVFFPYNPWDTGTRREGRPDEEALADTTKALDADGIFLDTMVQVPARLRALVDAARPGVTFEPEGHPAVADLAQCNASWGQWLQPFDEGGALHLKWLEPRHMQHQIRRWDPSRQADLAATWLNGSGILVWENVFGSWNPWSAPDRADLRRMVPVLRHHADLLCSDTWLPCFPTRVPALRASSWQRGPCRLWTLLSQDRQPYEGVAFEAPDADCRWFDLWNGTELTPARERGSARVSIRIERFGAVVALAPAAVDQAFLELLRHQREEAARATPQAGTADTHARALPVLEPRPPPAATGTWAGSPADLLAVPAGEGVFEVVHPRRECGCYPDAGTPEAGWGAFLTGQPFDGTLAHHIRARVSAGRIAAGVVTNAQYAAFVKATGYHPAHPERFLDHWGGGTCPQALWDEPVVYIDLDDARAYAAWTGARLPTEWEWQRAATQHGTAFDRGTVWEWTESQRDDGHSRFAMLRGGSRYRAEGSGWYFPGGPQPIETHAKFPLTWAGLDRCATIGFRCLVPGE